MAGFDRRTGQMIGNLEHAYQGVEVIMTTRIAERLMLREFGGGVAELLGRAVTPSLFLVWRQLIATAIDLWEPRFRVRSVTVSSSADEARLGTIALSIFADYRPYAHLPKTDSRYSLKVDRTVTFGVGIASGNVTVGTMV